MVCSGRAAHGVAASSRYSCRVRVNTFLHPGGHHRFLVVCPELEFGETKHGRRIQDDGRNLPLNRNKLVSFEPSTTTTILPRSRRSPSKREHGRCFQRLPFPFIPDTLPLPKISMYLCVLPCRDVPVWKIWKHAVSDTRYHRTNLDPNAAMPALCPVSELFGI
jgi:hypothetical protein